MGGLAGGAQWPLVVSAVRACIKHQTDPGSSAGAAAVSTAVRSIGGAHHPPSSPLDVADAISAAAAVRSASDLPSIGPVPVTSGSLQSWQSPCQVYGELVGDSGMAGSYPADTVGRWEGQYPNPNATIRIM